MTNAKFYQMGRFIMSEKRFACHDFFELAGHCVVFSGAALDMGNEDDARTVFNTIARVLNAENLLASNPEESVPVTQAPAPVVPTGGWLEWHGGECPMSKETRIFVRLRAGDELLGKASDFRWNHGTDSGKPLGGDIVAYRLASEAPASEKKDAPWQPKEGEDYYYINEGGEIDSTDYIACSLMDRVNKSFGNIFRTREEAEAKRAEIFGG